MVIKIKLTYNAIIGRPFLHEINIVISTKYLVIKSPTDRGIATIKGNKMISKEYNFICLPKTNVRSIGF